MAVLTKEQILQAGDLKTQTIRVPEWGGDVIVKTMTGKEREDYEVAVRGTNNRNIMAHLCATCLVGGDGKPLFTLDDVDALAAKSGAALARVFQVVLKLNYMTGEDLEILEKN